MFYQIYYTCLWNLTFLATDQDRLIKTGLNLLWLITEFPSWPEIEDNMALEHARHLLFPFFKYGDHMKD